MLYSVMEDLFHLLSLYYVVCYTSFSNQGIKYSDSCVVILHNDLDPPKVSPESR